MGKLTYCAKLGIPRFYLLFVCLFPPTPLHPSAPPPSRSVWTLQWRKSFSTFFAWESQPRLLASTQRYEWLICANLIHRAHTFALEVWGARVGKERCLSKVLRHRNCFLCVLLWASGFFSRSKFWGELLHDDPMPVRCSLLLLSNGIIPAPESAVTETG